MLDSSKTGQILLIAAAAGLVGGLIFELLLTRPKGRIGMIEWPARRLAGRLWDAGVVGSLIIGAGAAVAFLLAYKPVEVVVNGTTTKQYPVLELVAISLVAGAAGTSIFSALTKAATAAAENTKLLALEAGLKKLEEDAGEAPRNLDGSTGLRPDIAAQASLLRKQIAEMLDS